MEKAQLTELMENELEAGTLTATTHAQAITDFHTFLSFIQPPPNGEIALVLRAEAIRGAIPVVALPMASILR